ncbi:MAG: ABC transporter ATP-binding protein [Candidatus Bathyarchaeota archaeon]|nr:ABC transporter ATP-binding protein [Candidatus Bathyarchaeota archaeon]
MRKEKTVVEVRNLLVNFHTYRGEVKALNGVDLKLVEQEVLGLVGESGCGKSVTALTMLDLLPENAYVLGGEILLKGEDLLKKSKEERRALRISELATVFQDPMTFLNPVLKIETQLQEVFMLDKELLKRAVTWERTAEKDIVFLDLLSRGKRFDVDSGVLNVSGKEIRNVARDLCVDILKLVKMPDPERILSRYPFELSGGMRQRIMIAMALARRPSVLIADEITTAVDVTIQAQILHLLRELRDKIDTSILLITHDLSVAAEVANRIAVMYGGNVVEVAPTKEIFRNPLHPYTVMLLKSIPNIKKPVERLESIPGTVPEMINPPSGCRFHPRCSVAKESCNTALPKLREVAENHYVACH